MACACPRKWQNVGLNPESDSKSIFPLIYIAFVILVINTFVVITFIITIIAINATIIITIQSAPSSSLSIYHDYCSVTAPISPGVLPGRASSGLEHRRVSACVCELGE